jgi:antitoxin (DNA-binding transcriptional repressor) of toxin-antitoxin stability system
MTTITSKQFQLNQSAVMKSVAAGESVEVTFHGKPWVILEPARPVGPKPGSRQALERALTIGFPGVVPENVSYDELRAQMARDRFGV